MHFGKYYVSGTPEELIATTKAGTEAREEGTYLVGDKLTYRGERYYVISKSSSSKDYVTLLKMWPLTRTELYSYIYQTDESGNQVAIDGLSGSALGDRGGYGTIPWNRVSGGQNNSVCGVNGIGGCPTSYDGSTIKKVVDNWANLTLDMDHLAEVDGYKVRLLNDHDLTNNLKYSDNPDTVGGYVGTSIYFNTSKTPRWIVPRDYNVWMMDVDEDAKASVHMLYYDGIGVAKMYLSDTYYMGVIRPVINLKKSAITKENELVPEVVVPEEQEQNNTNNNNNNDNNTNTNTGGGGCLWIETEILVYDTKKKRKYRKKMKDLTEDDLILAGDFDKGEFVFVKPLWIRKIDKADSYYLLKFSDGSELRIIHDHRIFNADTNSFESGIEVKIGTRTFNSKGEIVELISREKIDEEIEYSSVITNYHMNLFAGDILTSIKLNNLYKIDNMKFVKENIVNNNKEDFCEMSDEMFDGLRLSEANFGDYYTTEGINEFVEGITPLNKI